MTKHPVFLLVLSCAAHRETRQLAIRETWQRRIPSPWKYFYVEGGAEEARVEEDRLFLPVPDDYNHLAEKTFRAVEFLLGNYDFEGLLKCDDDTYVHPPRFDSTFNRETDYAGSGRDTLKKRGTYAQGGCYWLSQSACRKLVSDPFETYCDSPWFLGNARTRKRGERRERSLVSIEDLMVGDILRRQGVTFTDDSRFSPDPFPSVYEDERLFSCHYVNPITMRRIHRQPIWRKHFLKRYFVPLIRFMPASWKPR